MKKENSTSLAIHLSKLDNHNLFEEPSMMNWLMRHGKKALYSILMVFIVLFLFSLWLMRDNLEVAKSYYAAKTHFQVFEKSNSAEKQNQALIELQKALTQYPALQAEYEGPIAQTLLNRGLVKESLPFAVATLKRTEQDRLNNFNAFAQISLLIAEKKYSQALDSSLSLKELLANGQDDQANDLLTAFNLLRIAFLQQMTGDKSQELQSWQAFKQYQEKLRQNNQQDKLSAINATAALFVNGKVSLNDYIEDRLKSLSS